MCLWFLDFHSQNIVISKKKVFTLNLAHTVRCRCLKMSYFSQNFESWGAIARLPSEQKKLLMQVIMENISGLGLQRKQLQLHTSSPRMSYIETQNFLERSKRLIYLVESTNIPKRFCFQAASLIKWCIPIHVSA